MRIPGCAPIVLAVSVLPRLAASAPDDWIGTIRRGHPRLLFNAESWPEIKQRALTVCRDHPCDEYISTIDQRADPVEGLRVETSSNSGSCCGTDVYGVCHPR